MQVDIPTASEVDVAVYDLLGRLVSRLMSGPQPAGSVTITWDGRDNAGMQVPTGMYIVRMTAGGFSASQKVLMMK
jgi:flagellar hook assembly protein FlgD